MMNIQNVLILVGSPKGKNSASNNIVSYINEKFIENGVDAEIDYIVKYQRPDRMEKLVKRAIESELLLLVAPLYIDSIPAITINFMENFYSYKSTLRQKGMKLNEEQVTKQYPKQKLLAVFNSGFPEPNHNDVAIEMCENFAVKADMGWVGGITIGMGAAFANRSLKDAGGMSRNLRKGLDTVIGSVSRGISVPLEAQLIASKPLLPLFLSKFVMSRFSEIIWKRSVKDKVVRKNMYNRPYET